MTENEIYHIEKDSSEFTESVSVVSPVETAASSTNDLDVEAARNDIEVIFSGGHEVLNRPEAGVALSLYERYTKQTEEDADYQLAAHAAENDMRRVWTTPIEPAHEYLNTSGELRIGQDIEAIRLQQITDSLKVAA
ncbi:MAG: hypothetical protein LBK50_03045 [Candidatus Nomurabacteria bacterium]|nr:hypothetical protein [Candidatus Nomurabacteria bacterium]